MFNQSPNFNYKIDLRLNLSHIFIDMRLIVSYIQNIAILLLNDRALAFGSWGIFSR